MSTAMGSENSPNLKDPPFVFILGCPGSGKSSLCTGILAHYNDRKIVHLSVGDLVREIRGDKDVGGYSDETRAIIKKHLPYGKFPTLVPANILLPGVLKPKLQHLQLATPSLILIDGFPRDLAQAEAAISVLGKPRGVWIGICSRDTAKKRYLQRGREADDEEMFDKRFKEFEENNELVLKSLNEMECSFHNVRLDGTLKESLSMASYCLDKIL